MSDLVSIAETDLFFSRIIAMIPHELYKHTTDVHDEIVNVKYYKHRKAPLEPDEKKLLSNQKRKAKYEASTDEFVHESEKATTDDDNNIPAIETSDNSLNDLRSRLKVCKTIGG